MHKTFHFILLRSSVALVVTCANLLSGGQLNCAIWTYIFSIAKRFAKQQLDQEQNYDILLPGCNQSLIHGSRKSAQIVLAVDLLMAAVQFPVETPNTENENMQCSKTSRSAFLCDYVVITMQRQNTRSWVKMTIFFNIQPRQKNGADCPLLKRTYFSFFVHRRSKDILISVISFGGTAAQHKLPFSLLICRSECGISCLKLSITWAINCKTQTPPYQVVTLNNKKKCFAREIYQCACTKFNHFAHACSTSQ